MYVELTKNNGTPYLRLVKNVRVTNSKGVKTSTKKVVLNIGPLSRYDDGKPDYLERLKESYKNGSPLIPELIPYVDSEATKIPRKYTIEFTEGDKLCAASPKRFASCLLDPVFSALGLDQLFASIKHSSRIEYDLQGIVRLLTYGRLLDPASKVATMRQNDLYYRPLVKSTNDDNVYDVLDVIYENRLKIIQRMNTCISKGTKRNTQTVFYDVTNFFFEIDEPDEDILDEDGEVIEKGTRKNGVCKEQRKQPIVQVGLFLDDQGIPISLEIFPGNTLDHLTFRDAMKNTVDTLNLNRFILIADRGMYTGTNMCHVLDQGHGYIVSKSLKKSTKKERQWALDPEGYTVVSPEFKYKSREVTRTVKGENGEKRKIKQKVVVYWSKAFYERERHENKSFLEFIEKLKENPSGFRVSAAQSRTLRKFMKKDVVNKETGEVLNSRKLLSMIDDEKLTEFNELMGYYQIVTSETEMDDLEIIDKYHELTRIEDQFHEMKGTLETRPIYLSTKEHIHAHLLVCFMALTMLRVMQRKLVNSMTEEEKEQLRKLNWSYGMSGRRFTEALLNWQVEQISNEYYRMVNTDSDDLKKILISFNIEIPLDLYTAGRLRSLGSNVNVF